MKPELVKPLRIAIVAACPVPCPRGTPIRITRTSEALAERGHDVHVAAYHLADGEIAPSVTVHRTPNVPTYSRLAPGPTLQKLMVMDPLLTVVLRRVLRQGRFDVIHAHHVEGLGVALAARPKGVPVVYDAHTSLRSELPFYRLAAPRSLLSTIGGAVDGFAARRADHIISVTEDLRRRLEQDHAVPAGKVTVVRNGVLWKRFQVDGPPPRAGVHPTIVFAGNLARYQGIETLLRATRHLLRTHPKARVVLAVEDESSFQPYRPLVSELGLGGALTVRKTAFVDLPAVLGAGTVAVNPRPACDGMPVKVLNYMAAGLPIVSCAGSAKGLEHGNTAWIVPDADPVAMAEGLAHLLDHPETAKAMGERARTRVREEASWEAAAQRIEGVYERILSHAR